MTKKNRPPSRPHLDEDPQTWIAQYGDYLLRFAQSRIGNRETAEDLAQETFLAAWNSRFRFAGQASLKTWLTGILKHKILDHYRRRASETAFRDLLDRHAGEDIEWLLDDSLFPAAWRASPAEEYDHKVLYAHFRKCSDSLSSRMREAFLYAEVDGLSGRQISQRLNISEANARTLVHRAKKMLRACLEHIHYRRQRR